MKTSLSVTKRKQTTLISRKSKRLRRKCSLRREYKKLRSLLPTTIKSPDLRHKAGVVDAAYQYIRHLQSALLDKFSSRGIPPDLVGVVGDKVTTAEDVQALALYLIRQNNNNNNLNGATPRTTNNNTSKNGINSSSPAVVDFPPEEEDDKDAMLLQKNGDSEEVSDSCSSFDSNSNCSEG